MHVLIKTIKVTPYNLLIDLLTRRPYSRVMGYRGVPGLLAAFLCLLYLEAGAAQGDEMPFGTDIQCLEAPSWSNSDGVDPMSESRGVVTVVSLLRAS